MSLADFIRNKTLKINAYIPNHEGFTFDPEGLAEAIEKEYFMRLSEERIAKIVRLGIESGDSFKEIAAAIKGEEMAYQRARIDIEQILREKGEEQVRHEQKMKELREAEQRIKQRYEFKD